MRSVRHLFFKTSDKSGTKQVSFKNIDKSGTKRVFKTMEETSNNSIHFKIFNKWAKARTANCICFKTFDDWVKARTANCDMALKDALGFVSGNNSALDGEKDPPGAIPAPSERSSPSLT